MTLHRRSPLRRGVPLAVRAFELGLLVHPWADPADIPINRGAA